MQQRHHCHWRYCGCLPSEERVPGAVRASSFEFHRPCNRRFAWPPFFLRPLPFLFLTYSEVLSLLPYLLRSHSDQLYLHIFSLRPPLHHVYTFSSDLLYSRSSVLLLLPAP